MWRSWSAHPNAEGRLGLVAKGSRSWLGRMIRKVALVGVVAASGLPFVVGSASAQTDPEMLKKFAEKNELLDQSFVKLLRRAESKFASREFDAAIGLGQSALNKRPSSGRATALIGYAYKAKKMYGQAIPYFQKAASLFDDKTEFFEKGQALYNVAFSYELMKQKDAAIGAWQTYLGFASNYPQEAQGVTFARERIAALQSVKR